MKTKNCNCFQNSTKPHKCIKFAPAVNNELSCSKKYKFMKTKSTEEWVEEFDKSEPMLWLYRSEGYLQVTGRSGDYEGKTITEVLTHILTQHTNDKLRDLMEKVDGYNRAETDIGGADIEVNEHYNEAVKEITTLLQAEITDES